MYGSTLKTSVSKLEQYSGCPFSYYLKYGLKLNDKETFNVEAVDTGSFMHDVIDNFFGVIEERNINLKEITDEELEKIVAEIVSEKLKLDRNYIFTTTSKYKVLSNRLQKVVTMSVKYIVQSLKQSEFEVFGHELEFGGDGQYKPITVITEDGKKVEITGKIDRVDIMKNPDGTYVRIIDYKSSVKNIDLNQVFYGLQLQLLTYLNETCKVEDFIPAGVLYFNLINPTIGTDKNLTDEEVEEKMDLVRDICSLGRDARETANIKVRQPISEVILDSSIKNIIGNLDSIIKEELNVKELSYKDDMTDYLTYTLKPNFKVLGKTLGSKIKVLQEQLKTLPSEEALKTQNESITIKLEGENFTLDAQNTILSIEVKDGYQASSDNKTCVVLNTNLTESLILEGLAREMVRTIQSLRKEKDFVITDHINVYYNGDTDIDHMLDTYKDYVENETLANKIEKQEVNSEEYDLNGHPIKIEVEKA